jgi:hypothetical protein
MLDDEEQGVPHGAGTNMRNRRVVVGLPVGHWAIREDRTLGYPGRLWAHCCYGLSKMHLTRARDNADNGTAIAIRLDRRVVEDASRGLTPMSRVCGRAFRLRSISREQTNPHARNKNSSRPVVDLPRRDA